MVKKASEGKVRTTIYLDPNQKNAVVKIKRKKHTLFLPSLSG